MFHASLTLLFAIVAVKYISYESKKKLDIKHGWQWLAMAVVLPIFANLLTQITSPFLGNVLLHMIGGGMSATCLFYYLYGLLGYKLNWRLELITLFAFVTCLGVFNEVLEFFIELTTDLVMAVDTQDTWRDFVANTTGMIIVWVGLCFSRYFRKTK